MYTMARHFERLCLFFFNDTATTEIYTLSLHDALPIYPLRGGRGRHPRCGAALARCPLVRSEEHTSELQSQSNLVCRLLLEKKKTKKSQVMISRPEPVTAAGLCR